MEDQNDQKVEYIKLYLKEENKEQPYFALKVDNTDVLVPDNVYE